MTYMISIITVVSATKPQIMPFVFHYMSSMILKQSDVSHVVTSTEKKNTFISDAAQTLLFLAQPICEHSRPLQTQSPALLVP